MDELFSPVLDGSLDELSDARSLAASIRGGGSSISDFMEAPAINNRSLNILENASSLSKAIKGGGSKPDKKPSTSSTLDLEVEAINNPNDVSLDEYITGKSLIRQVFVSEQSVHPFPHSTDLFQPIFVNDSLRRLTDKSELADSIKGGGTAHHSGTTNGFVTSPVLMSPKSPISPNQIRHINSSTPESFQASGAESPQYQQNMQRAFLQSAMVQNLQIQQQLLAQNQALQTLLSQQETTSPTHTTSVTSNPIQKSPPKKQNSKTRISSSPFSEMDRYRKGSSESNGTHNPPPIPPPMPPPIQFVDPSEARPFLDPYGRAKTVRIGKWRWPPPHDGNMNESDENFMHFKMRQNQRKQTPQSQESNSPNGSAAVDWEEFDVEPQATTVAIKNSIHHQSQRKFSQSEPSQSNQMGKMSRRSFEIGADRPPPSSVGKLKLSSEMRQRLEQVTSGHSVRSSTSTQSDKRAPAKLEDARKMMLQQQLSGHLFGNDRSEGADLPSVRTHIQRMEMGTRPLPPPWPVHVPPAPPGPAPPPPIRPPTGIPPMPPPPVPIAPITQHPQEMPAFVQRQERDTFGAHWNGSEMSKDGYDSWGRAEAAKLDMVYDSHYKKEVVVDRERSRSRSRSRDREHFSESVWDRSEVEGPPSSGSDRERYKEREKRDRIYELRQVEREKESNKVYKPVTSKPDTFEKEKIFDEKKTYEREHRSQAQERATFKTHMANRVERERKTSASTFITQSTDKHDEVDKDEWQAPIITAPAPVPPSLKSPASACLTYNRVPWKLRVRKEVFRPTELIGPPAALDLLFIQIASDVFGITSTLRINPQDKRAAMNLLGGHGVTADNMKGQIRAIVKRHLIDMARSWPLYFARLFVVSGSPQIPEVSILAVSHSGVYLARRDTDHITVIKSVPFAELSGAVTLPRPSALQLNLRNGNRMTLHAPRAQAIQMMVHTYCQEYRQVSF